jgi:hypothetical protein
VSSLILAVHGSLRWVILGAGAAATLRSALGWARGSAWTALDERLSLAFAVSADVQLVIGAALWLGASALGLQAVASEGVRGVASSPELRFWVALHPILATAALALAHAARIRMRSISSGPARHRIAALLFASALALLGVAISHR